MRYAIMVLLALVLLTTLCQSVSAFPTSLNVIPTADFMDPYEARIEYENDGYTSLFKAEAENLYMLQMGVTPRLEVGLDFLRYDLGTDMMLNAKYLLLNETETLPALAIGAQELGEGAEQTYYVVGSKDVGQYRLHLGAVGDDESYVLMAGLEKPLTDTITLLADYTGGNEGYTTLGAYWEPNRGPAVTVGYGFANDSASDDFVMLNLAWSWSLLK